MPSRTPLVRNRTLKKMQYTNLQQQGKNCQKFIILIQLTISTTLTNAFSYLALISSANAYIKNKKLIIQPIDIKMNCCCHVGRGWLVPSVEIISMVPWAEIISIQPIDVKINSCLQSTFP
jgi:hypothetical protein